MRRSSRNDATGPGSRGGQWHIPAFRSEWRKAWRKAHPESGRDVAAKREKRRAAQLVKDAAGMTEPLPKGRLLTSAEVAEYLAIHVNTVKRLGDAGHLRYFMVSTRGDRRYRMRDVEQFLRERRSK